MISHLHQSFDAAFDSPSIPSETEINRVPIRRIQKASSSKFEQTDYSIYEKQIPDGVSIQINTELRVTETIAKADEGKEEAEGDESSERKGDEKIESNEKLTGVLSAEVLSTYFSDADRTSDCDPTRDDSIAFSSDRYNDEDVGINGDFFGHEPSPSSPNCGINVMPGRPTGNGISCFSGRGLKTIDVHELKESYHSDLSNIRLLNLSDNRLSSIPSSVLESLGSLRVLDLTNNRLTFLNADLSKNCPYLEELNLDHNQLEFLPDCICELPNLRILTCSKNSLTSLPLGIGKSLLKLNILNIENNRIKVLPPSLGEMRSLHTLSVSGNYFSTVPISLAQLTHLTSLSLDWFGYCGPSYSRRLSSPEELHLIDQFR